MDEATLLFLTLIIKSQETNNETLHKIYITRSYIMRTESMLMLVNHFGEASPIFQRKGELENSKMDLEVILSDLEESFRKQQKTLQELYQNLEELLNRLKSLPKA